MEGQNNRALSPAQRRVAGPNSRAGNTSDKLTVHSNGDGHQSNGDGHQSSQNPEDLGTQSKPSPSDGQPRRNKTGNPSKPRPASEPPQSNPSLGDGQPRRNKTENPSKPRPASRPPQSNPSPRRLQYLQGKSYRTSPIETGAAQIINTIRSPTSTGHGTKAKGSDNLLFESGKTQKPKLGDGSGIPLDRDPQIITATAFVFRFRCDEPRRKIKAQPEIGAATGVYDAILDKVRGNPRKTRTKHVCVFFPPEELAQYKTRLQKENNNALPTNLEGCVGAGPERPSTKIRRLFGENLQQCLATLYAELPAQIKSQNAQLSSENPTLERLPNGKKIERHRLEGWFSLRGKHLLRNFCIGKDIASLINRDRDIGYVHSMAFAYTKHWPVLQAHSLPHWHVLSSPIAVLSICVASLFLENKRARKTGDADAKMKRLARRNGAVLVCMIAVFTPLAALRLVSYLFFLSLRILQLPLVLLMLPIARAADNKPTHYCSLRAFGGLDYVYTLSFPIVLGMILSAVCYASSGFGLVGMCGMGEEATLTLVYCLVGLTALSVAMAVELLHRCNLAIQELKEMLLKHAKNPLNDKLIECENEFVRVRINWIMFPDKDPSVQTLHKWESQNAPAASKPSGRRASNPPDIPLCAILESSLHLKSGLEYNIRLLRKHVSLMGTAEHGFCMAGVFNTFTAISIVEGISNLLLECVSYLLGLFFSKTCVMDNSRARKHLVGHEELATAEHEKFKNAFPCQLHTGAIAQNASEYGSLRGTVL